MKNHQREIKGIILFNTYFFTTLSNSYSYYFVSNYNIVLSKYNTLLSYSLNWYRWRGAVPKSIRLNCFTLFNLILSTWYYMYENTWSMSFSYGSALWLWQYIIWLYELIHFIHRHVCIAWTVQWWGEDYYLQDRPNKDDLKRKHVPWFILRSLNKFEPQ